MMAKLGEGESGKFIANLVDEILSRAPDGGPLLDYDVNAPSGEQIEIRNPAPAPSGAAN